MKWTKKLVITVSERGSTHFFKHFDPSLDLIVVFQSAHPLLWEITKENIFNADRLLVDSNAGEKLQPHALFLFPRQEGVNEQVHEQDCSSKRKRDPVRCATAHAEEEGDKVYHADHLRQPVGETTTMKEEDNKEELRIV